VNEKRTWQWMRRILYDLKRQYSAHVYVYKLKDARTDYRTGTKTVRRDIHEVRTAIMLPEEVSRRVEQGIAHLSANKRFVSQAGYDLGKASFIFDARDLPAGFQFELDDYVLIEGDYYKVVEVDEFEYDTGWIIKTHHVEGVTLAALLELDAESLFILSDGAEAS
jgi:hypothetical protein